MFPVIRMRRLRKDPLRDIFREVEVKKKDLIVPVFVDENLKKPVEINSMPSYFRIPLSDVTEEIKNCLEMDLNSFIFFGIPSYKDERGSSAFDREGVIQKAVRVIKKEYPEAIVVTDVCLCEYTTHGHCGLVKDGKILNDPTLELIAETALSHAEAGADIVAPSGMMDGMVKAIREKLDDHGFEDIPIMSYSAKYASNFYSPFREAADSGFAFGDRKSYQMDIHNSNEALREIELDIKEGADIVMVKPALAYLDIIRRVKETFNIPLAAYNVSGEYSMVKAAEKNGWLDGKAIAYEILTSIKRAGADLIITYHAKELAEMLG
ncbi:porphobilinogen synthase [Archaeoglobales archaeon]|nr:MAG: porphobilinogen synthase [Archaeoglobales archaeon]